MSAVSFSAVLFFIHCSFGVINGDRPSFLSSEEKRESNTSEHNELHASTSLFNRALQNFRAQDTELKNSCFKDLTTVASALQSSTPAVWAVTMLDSFGKPNSGILKGAVQWSGSFSQCRSVVYEKEGHGFRGKYCWAHFSLKPKIIQTLLPGSEMTSVGAKLGICVPDSCVDEELLQFGTNLTGSDSSIDDYAELTEIECIVDTNIKDEPWDIILLIFACAAVLFICVGTFYDIWTQGEDQQYSVLRAVSAYSNGKKLMTLSDGSRSIPTLNGIRVLSMVFIVMGHSILVPLSCIDNVKSFIEQNTGYYLTLMRQGSISVDSFFFISGLLVAYMFVAQHQRSNGKIPWSRFYIHRIWRLSLPYFLNLAFVDILASRYLGHSPFWSFATATTDICRDYWWANILYVNNFMPYYKQCMGQMWYLACDMQFYIFSPLLLIPIAKWATRWSVITVALSVAGSCGIAAYLGSITNSPITEDFEDMFPGSQQYIETYNIFYIKPYSRVTPYIVGMATGWFLQRTKTLTIPKILVFLGWAITLTLVTMQYMVISQPIRTDIIFKGFYHALGKFLWSLCLAWIVTSSSFGYGGVIGRFLSWRGWDLLAPFTYTVYLINDGCLALIYLSTDVTTHFGVMSSAVTSIAAVVMIFAGSFVFTLLFDAPFVGLESYLWPRKKSNTQVAQEHHRKT